MLFFASGKRPLTQGTWGIYETAAGKRFYLVKRASKYDQHLQTMSWKLTARTFAHLHIEDCTCRGFSLADM